MSRFVVYWNNIPSPYMVDRFNELADRGNFEFEAWFNDRIESGRSWDVREADWRFRYRYLPKTHVLGHSFRWPLPLFGRRPDVLVTLYAEPVFLLGWALAKLRGAKTAFWCQVTIDRWVQRKAWKNAVKRIVFPRVDATLGSGEDSRSFAMRFGTPADRSLRLRHSIDVAHYMGGAAQAQPERKALRAELGLKGTTFVYVGRLWWGKGLNYLLDAFETVQRQSAEEVSLLLVGDGSEETALRRVCAERGILNVVFAGFQQKPELPRYYAVADIFVFPTLGDPYGLVVDEAMACGLPVISTSAAGEIRDRIEDGINGYIVPPEDSAALASSMLKLSRDPDARTRMGQMSSDKIQGHTPQQWAEDFERIVSFMLSENTG
ncbi:glycosyltransferase family 4 protein [Salinisphaera sp. LB1]|uniref:glycosyltransferase family 4 protein n=1 Tax=Salinisphaera sp. LB1 TaxID=2183911 RepID=UPI000D706FBD|nr:glycosyltransferase family 4 protein [Salinisphaera sp. LB1]